VTLEQVYDQLKKTNIVKFGKFKFRSGIDSDKYLDVKEILGDYEVMDVLLPHFVNLIDPQTTCVAGMGVGGVPLAAQLLNYKFNAAYIRDKERDHGIPGWLEGYKPKPFDKVTVVDDVRTSGGTLLEASSRIETTGATILGYCVIVDWHKNPKVLPHPFKALMTVEELLSIYEKKK